MLYNHLSSHIGHIGPCHFAPLATLLRKQDIGYITGGSNSLYKGAFTPSSPPGRRYRSGWLSVDLPIYSTYLIAKIPSASGRHGLSTILHTRDEPRPLRSDSRVVDACALLVSYGTTTVSVHNVSATVDCQLCSSPSQLHLHRLLRVSDSELSSVDLRNDLVCHNDRDTELPSAFTCTGVRLTSSARRISVRRNLARCICRAASSPRPLKSVRYSDVMESTIRSENLPSAASWRRKLTSIRPS